MHYAVTLHVADRTMNCFMRECDLKPEYKVFVHSEIVEFDSKEPLTEKILYGIIEKSKNEKYFWIPAITFCNKIYVDKEVKEISDGKNIIFVNNT